MHIKGTAPGAPDNTPLKDIELKSLNDLHGRVHAILADLFFHMFTKEQQYTLARSLASLLSPTPGSMIFGNHAGLQEEGLWEPDNNVTKLYCHSDKSWRKMWEDIFGKENVDVQVTLRAYAAKTDLNGSFPGNMVPLYELEWSITRL